MDSFRTLTADQRILDDRIIPKDLTGLGAMVENVVLSGEFNGDEAMLLYDMDVDQLGKMRIAEHFTVADGRTTRIRQIHDTAALRAAGLAQSREACRSVRWRGLPKERRRETEDHPKSVRDSFKW